MFERSHPGWLCLHCVRGSLLKSAGVSRVSGRQRTETKDRIECTWCPAEPYSQTGVTRDLIDMFAQCFLEFVWSVKMVAPSGQNRLHSWCHVDNCKLNISNARRTWCPRTAFLGQDSGCCHNNRSHVTVCSPWGRVDAALTVLTTQQFYTCDLLASPWWPTCCHLSTLQYG